MMVSKKKTVGDGQFKSASPKGGWFFKKFQVATLAEDTDAQHTDSRSRKQVFRVPRGWGAPTNHASVL